jgi:hypothetical protein
VIWSKTAKTHEGERDSRDPTEAKRRGVLALALGKRSCFAEYQ